MLIPNGFELVNELGFVFKDIFAHRLNCPQNRRFQNRCFHIVRDAIVCGASVVAALKSGIRIIAFAAVLGFWADKSHSCAAVSAVHQPGQAVGVGAVRHSRLFL